MRLTPLLRFRTRTFVAASICAAALLLTLVLAPQIAARQARLEVLRRHVDQVARLAASHVDGDLHRALLDGRGDRTLLAEARKPLMRLHETWPEAFYVYTMAIIDGRAHFVLDTAQDPAFARRRGLRASRYMEPFEQRPQYRDDWLERLAAGEVYVTPGFQQDDYGIFLSGHAPIFDSAGRMSGFVGVDFSLDYYLAQDARFRRIEFASGAVALLLSLLLGYAYAQRDYVHRIELDRHYQRSMRDPLTGLPNRRGAMAAINDAWEGWADPATHAAVMLVDVDNFKGINDSRGHQVGDDVLRALARALRSTVRPGDITARLGGDEFLIFAHDCDRAGAAQMAQRLLAAVRAARAPVPFTVSVGCAITTGPAGGFDLLCRQADAALYKAKNGGRDGFAIHEEEQHPQA
jgi:diguanylate cyclase (GGDEF)-like protein